jgi:Zn-dependent M16 (insulinase) family peptidase
VHYAKGPSGWDHPMLPTLLLASSVLNASESYLWKSIRGSGLAYGANVGVDVESGLMEFSVYRVSALFTFNWVDVLMGMDCRVLMRGQLMRLVGSS